MLKVLFLKGQASANQRPEPGTVLRPRCTFEPPGSQAGSASVRLGQGLRVCVSEKLPGDADAAKLTEKLVAS